MIKVFYGDDRKRAFNEAKKFLGGDGYEAIEGSELTPEDLPNIFQGTTLFAMGGRRILLRDALESPAGVVIAEYAATPYRAALLETKVDKRGSAWKKVSEVIECQEFKTTEVETRVMFDIYRVAKRDGRAAVEKLREIRETLEPKAFIGVIAAQAFRDYAERAGAKEKRVLKELAKLDMELGATTGNPERPWLLIEGFLVRLGRM